LKSKTEKQKELNTTRRVSSALDQLRVNGKRATRLALKEIKEIYNSMNHERTLKRGGYIDPAELREEIYLRHFSCLPRGF
jgi:phage-related protein